MSEPLLRACPSVIVLIMPGAGGVETRLRELLALSDAIVREGLAIVEMDPTPDGETPHPRCARVVDGEDHLTIDAAIETAISTVQGQRTLDRLADAGYHVVDGAQFFIVVENSDPLARAQAGTALTAIRHVTQARFEIRRRVAYVLLNLPDETNRHLPRETFAPVVPKDALERQSADFVFVYDAIAGNLQQAVATRPEVEYDVAEALFALTATGLAEAGVIETTLRALRERTAPQTFAPFIGNLSTTMIRFPQADIQSYATADLAAKVMGGWTPGTGAVTQAAQTRYFAAGHDDVERFKVWLWDGERRPGTIGAALPTIGEQATARRDTPTPIWRRGMPPGPRHLWPTMRVPERPDSSAEVIAQDAGQRTRAEGLMRRLFQRFNPQTIEMEWDANRSLEKTCALLAAQASDAFTEWNALAAPVWADAARVVAQQTERRVVRLWQESPTSGATHARFYVGGLLDQTRLLGAELDALRTTHAQRYRDTLVEYDRRAKGPWETPDAAPLIRQDATQIGTPAQAAPRLPPPPTQAEDEDLPRGGLNTRERRLAERLRQRTQFHRLRIPTAFGMGMLALGGAPTLFLLLAALLPGRFVAAGAGLAVTALLALASVAALAGANYWRRFSAYRLALDDLAGFFLAIFAYRCEDREDTLRQEAVVTPLQAHFAAMQQRLASMEQFFGSVARALADRRAQAEQEFFANPATSRDVFVADGARLQQVGVHTLASVAAILDGQRAARRPAQDLATIRDRVLDALRTGRDTLFTITEAQAQALLLAIAGAVIADLLDDHDAPLVNIQTALRDPEVQRQALARLDRARYRLSADQGRHSIIVCGRDPDRQPFVSASQDEIATRPREWLLLVKLIQGGDPGWLDAERLFPDNAGVATAPNPA